MKVDPSTLSRPQASPPSPARTAPRDRAQEPRVKSAIQAQPDAPEQDSEPVEIDNMRVFLRFKEDKETGVHVIQVIDPDTGKLVRQIPPEEMLNVTKTLRDVKGLLVSRSS